MARLAAILAVLLFGTGSLARAAEPEPNGSRATAPSISGGVALSSFAPNGIAVVNGNLGDGDIDYFSVGVRGGEPVTLALFEEARGELDDPQLVVFASDGTEIARNDDGGPGFFSRLALTPSADDTWTVAVTRFPDTDLDGDTGAAFSYALVVSVNAAGAVLDSDISPGPQGSNDALATAQPLPAGGGVANGALVPGDSDFFSFQAGEGDSIVVSLFDGAGGERNDSVLRLHRGSELVLAEDDDGGPHFLSNLVRKVGPGEGGAWQVEVSGFAKVASLPHEETFDYQLVVTTARAAPTVLPCDVNNDGAVDRRDVDAIFAARGTTASGPNDPRDADHDGQITVLDSRACTLQCSLANCALVPGKSCGLLGPEALLALLPGAAGLRRLRLTGRA